LSVLVFGPVQKSMNHKRLILIRHAHRDTEVHSLDNGLSEKGKKQVRQLVRFSESREIDGAEFISSPKLRCVETLTPLANSMKSNVTIDRRIGEGTSASELGQFVDWWKYEGPDLLVVCSHGDVIPLLVQEMTGGQITIKKAGWCEVELVGSDVYLTWLVQKYE
jgi:broad specificity phosphatase PhoE